MKFKLNRGTTGKLLRIFVQDASQPKIAGLPGLTWNSPGMSWYYASEGGVSTVVPIVSASVGTWVSGGFVALDNTNMPGVYEIGTPDASLLTGASSFMMLKGAVNMSPVPIEIELDTVNYQSSTNFASVSLNGTQVVPMTGNIANSLFDCLNAGRAQGFGKWTMTGTVPGILTLFGPDGTTVIKTLNVDNTAAPTTRY